ncbi:MAG: DsbA family protein [Xanthomonadaceae bacterium]|jgi:predicted DsbA family dithiol-disulfide isomerase|nr:DsbA family protein [Xanthomonadaceae bacterium]
MLANFCRCAWIGFAGFIVETVGETLFRAYFAEGRNLTDRETLIRAESAGGLGERRTKALLASGRDQGSSAGPDHGVPTFIIDGRYAIQGAQAPDVFADAIRRIVDEPGPGPSAGTA